MLSQQASKLTFHSAIVSPRVNLITGNSEIFVAIKTLTRWVIPLLSKHVQLIRGSAATTAGFNPIFVNVNSDVAYCVDADDGC